MTTRIVVFTAVLAGLFWIDPLFVPLVLLGPIVTGLIVGPRGLARPAAGAWFAAGVITLVIDWVVNNEDQVFHLVMAVWTAGLTLAVGALSARLHRNRVAAAHRQPAGS